MQVIQDAATRPQMLIELSQLVGYKLKCLETAMRLRLVPGELIFDRVSSLVERFAK